VPPRIRARPSTHAAPWREAVWQTGRCQAGCRRQVKDGFNKEELAGTKTPEERTAVRESIKAELAKIETIDGSSPITAEFATLASEIGINAEGAKKLAEFDQKRTEKLGMTSARRGWPKPKKARHSIAMFRKRMRC